MTDKLQQRIRQVEEEAADEQLTSHLAEHKQRARDRALMLVGGFKAASKIAKVIDSEVMRGLEIFQKDEIYLSLGFLTMVDFLNSDQSPLTKSQYYERKALLEKEGDQLFDAFSSLGLSARRRKLLGKGSVELDGETVIVKDGDQETSIDLTDRSRLLETLTALADANSDKSAKLEKQKAAIDKHDDKVRELYTEIDRVKAAKAADVNDDPHSIALVNLTFAYKTLAETVGDMNEIEREQFAPRDFQLIAALNAELASAYGRNDWTKISAAPAAAVTGDDVDAILTHALDEDESNDDELASQL